MCYPWHLCAYLQCVTQQCCQSVCPALDHCVSARSCQGVPGCFLSTQAEVWASSRLQHCRVSVELQNSSHLSQQARQRLKGRGTEKYSLKQGCSDIFFNFGCINKTHWHWWSQTNGWVNTRSTLTPDQGLWTKYVLDHWKYCESCKNAGDLFLLKSDLIVSPAEGAKSRLQTTGSQSNCWEVHSSHVPYTNTIQ